MKRITTTALLLLVLLAVGGCSVFGIATRGELEEAMNREAVQQRVVEDRLDALQRRLATTQEELETIDQRLTPQVTALDAQVTEVATDMETARLQWAAVRDALIAQLDSMQTEYAVLRTDVIMMRDGFGAVTADAQDAQVRSREAMQIHYDKTLAERHHLMMQLEQLDLELAAWQTDPAAMEPLTDPAAEQEIVPTSAPVGDEGRVIITPAGATPLENPFDDTLESGKIEIRAVEPEKPATRTGGTSANGS